jgi:hypothetical protein
MPEKLKELCSGCRRGAGAPRLLFDGPPNCAAIRQPRGRTFGRVADEWQHSRTQGRRSGAEPTRRRTVALWGLRPGRRAAVSSHPALASSPVAARPLGQTGTKSRSRSRVVHKSCGMPATGSNHAGFGPWPEYCRSYAGEPRRPRRPGAGGTQRPTADVMRDARAWWSPFQSPVSTSEPKGLQRFPDDRRRREPPRAHWDPTAAVYKRSAYLPCDRSSSATWIASPDGASDLRSGRAMNR